MIFQGTTAVITGAASGIGRGIALEAASRDMNLVLADVDGAALSRLKADLDLSDSQVIFQEVDVTNLADLELLASKTSSKFGCCDFLFNNAGIMITGNFTEVTPANYSKVVGVNLLGAMHCLHAFLPQMLESRNYAHVVNTSSLGGLLSWKQMSSYAATKAAVVALTEAIHYEHEFDDGIGFSVLCPGTVQSNIVSSSLDNSGVGEEGSLLARQIQSNLNEFGMEPQSLAKIVFGAISERRYWIFPHPEFKPELNRRISALMQEITPDSSLSLFGVK
ncbi:SDR family NAD(P)-dependent oxidoreductase [Zhongshania aquimaris]|uniref:SDR family NAD(P)-dependent oxidoreductase n=1 Tax=Zhongshania aquimaris TaxID=2857107 RepID=A0ABS6VW01_9GAMM|nr:SDR family NAD(P)-dependent oxidoreductase [Zhongshania aquimaris]MBW2942188.1 SDR family NAD(P)-dependent oxidoreductase [Zhongshania aquimaris]